MPVTANAVFFEPEYAGAATGAGAAAKSIENSGKVPSDFQPESPSVRAGVVEFARPSAIHWRNKSAESGPYSLPSTPMIRYMEGLWLTRSGCVKSIYKGRNKVRGMSVRGIKEERRNFQFIPLTIIPLTSLLL